MKKRTISILTLIPEQLFATLEELKTTKKYRSM